MSDRVCSCTNWQEGANDPFLPIWFNSIMNEYVILFGKVPTNAIVIYYCPSCGGRMPKSQRADFFTIPSDVEVAEVRAILEQITDSVSMRLLMGEPDEVFEWYKDNSDGYFSNPEGPEFKYQYTYSSRWKTLEVVVQEYDRGELRYFLHGKPKPNAFDESKHD